MDKVIFRDPSGSCTNNKLVHNSIYYTEPILRNVDIFDENHNYVTRMDINDTNWRYFRPVDDDGKIIDCGY